MSHSACMSEPPANDWERQYHESIVAENAAHREASLEYEPTIEDLRTYLLVLFFPAAFLGVALGWVSEQLGTGRWPGTVVGVLIWFVILAVMVWRWCRARSLHRRTEEQS